MLGLELIHVSKSDPRLIWDMSFGKIVLSFVETHWFITLSEMPADNIKSKQYSFSLIQEIPDFNGLAQDSSNYIANSDETPSDSQL